MQYKNYSETGHSKPRSYLSIAAVCAAVVFVLVKWAPLKTTNYEQYLYERQQLLAGTDQLSDDNIEADDEVTEEDASLSDGELPIEPEIVKQYTVVAGDTLSRILTQFGINKSDIFLLSRQHKRIVNLRIGQTLSWDVDENKRIKSLKWIVSQQETINYVRSGQRFIEEKEVRLGEWKNIVIQGKISSTFSASARAAGLTSREISEILNSIQWQVNFKRLKSGDRFAVLLSREVFNNKHERSKLLGVRVNQGGKDYYAFPASGGRYLNEEGRGPGRGFSRYPLLKSAPISSHFNPARLHPITRRRVPHNGVDFAVPTGTPVIATNDGVIVTAKYSPAAGNYIAIRHDDKYLTRFMHLSKILVKEEQTVKKGDQIALSGNTGRSTAPHLHYELHINGKPVNPMTANLPRTSELSGRARTAFLDQAKQVTRQLKFN